MERINFSAAFRKFLIFHFIFAPSVNAQGGIIIAPVTDLVGQPMAHFFPHKPVAQAYADLAWAAKGTHNACPRIMQLLFNERVDIMDEHGPEVKVRIPHVYYQTRNSLKPQDEYWMLKKDVISYADLSRKKIALECLPGSISYSGKNSNHMQQIVTLTEPFHAKETKTTYSAGTRFVVHPEQATKDMVLVYVFDPKDHIIKNIQIPLATIWIPTKKAPHELINDYVQLIRNWAQSHGIIPYVWGGCSFTHALPSNVFHEEHTVCDKKQVSIFTRPQKVTGSKSGFDCSGLIIRAAQIVGIPYYFRNTFTLMKNLDELKPHQSIETGDLIWINGHVLIVADAHTNRIINANSYGEGYGYLQEVELHNIFNGIHTFDQLKAALFKKIPLERLNTHGQVSTKYAEFKVLKMKSLWRNGGI